MNDTYIKLFRKVVENDLFNEKPFDRWHAFEWLLVKAYRFPQDKVIKGKVVHIDAGQYLISQRELANTFGWSVNKLIRFQKLLEKLKMARFDGDTYGNSIGTLITIENYTKYQGGKNSGGDSKRSTNGDTGGNSDGDSLKKDKKDKEYINNNIYGEYRNVVLSAEAYEKLMKEFPQDYKERIEKLSEYMASTGKKYKNHLATIRNWARRERENANTGQDQQTKRAGERHTDEDYTAGYEHLFNK